MGDSNPANRLFASDVYTLVLYHGDLEFSELDYDNPSHKVYNMLALFRSFRLSCAVTEDDGSATWDTGHYPLPYRQRWTCEVEMAQDMFVTGNQYDSIYHLFRSLGVGPYWLVFKKAISAVNPTLIATPYGQRGSINNFADIVAMDGPQLQTATFSMWGVPVAIPVE
jgi:hypothetical protein